MVENSPTCSLEDSSLAKDSLGDTYTPTFMESLDPQEKAHSGSATVLNSFAGMAST